MQTKYLMKPKFFIFKVKCQQRYIVVSEAHFLSFKIRTWFHQEGLYGQLVLNNILLRQNKLHEGKFWFLLSLIALIPFHIKFFPSPIRFQQQEIKY